MFHDKIVEFDSEESAENFLMGYVKEENYCQFCKENGITYRLLDVKDELGNGTINLTNEQIFFIDAPLEEEFYDAEN